MRIARGISVTNTSKPISTAIAYDADATAFFTAASITDTTQKNAVNTLVLSLKSANIWAKMKALYPVIGGSSSSHAVNLKQPGTFNLSFATGWTHSSTGMTPNGATYANSFFNPFSQSFSLTSQSLTIYNRTACVNGTTRFYMGSSDGADIVNNMTALAFANGGTLEIGTLAGKRTGTDYAPPSSNNSFAGLKIVTTNGTRTATYYKNGIKNINTVLQTGSNPNYTYYLGAFNEANIAKFYLNVELSFASIGDGLSDAEALSFYNAVQGYQTTLNRQV